MANQTSDAPPIPVKVRLSYSGKAEKFKAVDGVILELSELSNKALQKAVRRLKLPDLLFDEPDFDPDDLKEGQVLVMKVLDPE